MSRADIEAAIPHRPPMLLLDEIVERSEDHITCLKAFRADEFFFQGHYPDYPLVPGVILIEAAMQAGAVLVSHVPLEGGVPVATRVNDVKFKKMIRPGDTVRLEVKLQERLADTFFMTAKVTCEGKTAATFNFAVTAAKSDATPEA
jgi:3-hydroxyacyl-[acyl-carrier-protein] dehydratase